MLERKPLLNMDICARLPWVKVKTQNFNNNLIKQIHARERSLGGSEREKQISQTLDKNDRIQGLAS